MMLPILISVSVAPVSYFFCASAPLLDAAASANAAAMTILLAMAGMSVSLFPSLGGAGFRGDCASWLPWWKALLTRSPSTILPCPSQEKALRERREGLLL